MAAFTVWINVNGFSSTHVQMKDQWQWIECGPATYVSFEFRHPTTKTERSVRGPFSEGHETQLNYPKQTDMTAHFWLLFY